MIIWFIALLKVIVSNGREQQHVTGVTPHLAFIDDLNIGEFQNAEHRGPRFYSYTSESGSGTDIEEDSTDSDESTSSSTSRETSDVSTSASSFETTERKRGRRVYRTCKACPQDMLKKHQNIGIRWICGGYQRARRSFKSECMMRYRNCEDGTMFVKLHDHRCKNDTYHGKHWFYIYKT